MIEQDGRASLAGWQLRDAGMAALKKGFHGQMATRAQ